MHRRNQPQPHPKTQPQPHMRLTGGVYVTEEERPPPPTTTTTTTGGGRGRKRGGASSATSSSGNGNGGFVFVRQEDLFYSQLTVREILQFTSRLRLPRGVPDREKRAAVEEMLSRMGLLEVSGGGVHGCRLMCVC